LIVSHAWTSQQDQITALQARLEELDQLKAQMAALQSQLPRQLPQQVALKNYALIASRVLRVWCPSRQAFNLSGGHHTITHPFVSERPGFPSVGTIAGSTAKPPP
jgi:hypothetical protein